MSQAYAGLKSKEPEAKEILAKLSLKQKIQLCSGQDLWHLKPILDIPPIVLTDGPHGVIVRESVDLLEGRKPSTCFPTASALASLWDVDLVERVGVAVGRESFASGVAVLLGPGMNIKRHPCCGRNFEYFSEDPYLTGQLGTAFVRGVQSQGVGSCIKHICVNNQEYDRFRVNTVVDERTLREVYLRGFEMAIKASQPWTVMTAYNKLNGTYCSEHERLWNEILRKEWGFEGIIMTDWGAVNDRVRGIRNGVDLEMPGSFGANDELVEKAIETHKTLTLHDLDKVVTRNLCLSLLGKEALERKSKVDIESSTPVQVDYEAHHTLARHVAQNCAVLLKNNDNFLPLKDGTSVAVIGEFAKNPRYQGMGSSQVLPTKLDKAWDFVTEHSKDCVYAPGYAHNDLGEEINKALIEEAVEAAKQKQVAIIFCGLPGICESEGFDRPSMDMPKQHNELIQAVCAANPSTVVVLSNGPPVTVSSWMDCPKAILEGYLSGQASGSAIADLLFGVVSPSGKLAETFPIALEHVAAHAWYPGENQQVEYREGLNVGYRYFDSANVSVSFPFGHGLSYATFQYTNLRVRRHAGASVEVSLDVQNTGSMLAAEVVQCYVHAKESDVYRPDQELKAFQKILLHPGEKKRATIYLDSDAFHFYDTGVKDWIVEPGTYELRIGSSSRDIRLSGEVKLADGTQRASELAKSSFPALEKGKKLQAPLEVSDESFASMMLGVATPEGEVVNSFHYNSVIGELRRSFVGSIIEFFVRKEAVKHMASEEDNEATKKTAIEMLHQMPLRSLVLFSQGNLNFHKLDIMLALLNHQYFLFFKLLISKERN